jgi:hypothetical protein
MFFFRSDGSAARSLGSSLDLPLGDANAESFADSLYPHVKAREEDILAIADLPPLEDKTILFLQEILCKLSTFLRKVSKISASMLFVSPPISSSGLLSLFLPYHQQRNLALFCLYTSAFL